MRKLFIGLVAALLLVSVVSVAAFAQGNLREYTGYQVMNLSSTQNANVRVDYYGPNGGSPVCTKNLDPIAPLGSTNIQQKTENCNGSPLADGVYSAVLSSDQPIAAVVGQQMSDPGVGGAVYEAPFSEYSGASAGSRTVNLPELMSKWYGIDSLIRVQNTGNAVANISVQYYAGSLGGTPTGNTSIAAKTYTIQPFAAITLDQGQINADLAATSGTYMGKFLGSAVITSDQPLATVVNQTNPTTRRKYTYNGFGSDESAADVLAPAIFWQWYNTLTSMAVQNPSTTNSVDVTITYTAGPGSLTLSNGNAAGQTKVVNFTLGPGQSSTRYEGNAANSDLAGQFNRFGGSARITATGPVVAKVNQEQYTKSANNQDFAGAYNAFPVNKLTTSVAVPLIQAGFYNFYTSLTCANASAETANITIHYTSDSLSAKPNLAGDVAHTIAPGGSIIVYEGQLNGSLADIYKTSSQWYVSGARNIFNGSAFVTSTNGKSIACTVNEHNSVLPYDAMYTYNGINLAAGQ